jgi:hypothetical protein
VRAEVLAGGGAAAAMLVGLVPARGASQLARSRPEPGSRSVEACAELAALPDLTITSAGVRETAWGSLPLREYWNGRFLMWGDGGNFYETDPGVRPPR